MRCTTREVVCRILCAPFRPRARVRRLATAAIGVVGGACADAQGGVSACIEAPITWSEARTIWSENADSIQAYPLSAASYGNVVYATAVHLSTRGPLFPPPRDDVFAVKASLAGGAPVTLPPPPGGTRYEYPLIAATSDGRATVVWGERYAEPGETDSARVRSLWTATYDGERWTPAERIAVAHAIRWNGHSPSELIATPNGDLHLATPVDAVRGRVAILYLTRRGMQWRAHEIPLRSSEAVYVSLGVQGEWVAVVYIAAVLGIRNVNSVFFNSSSDGGHTWGPGSLVSQSGTHPAREPRIVAPSSRNLHLVWGQDYSGTNTLDAIRHVSSSNGGGTWTAPTDLGVPYEPYQVRGAALAPGENVYVLFTQRRIGGGLAATRWCGGRWHGARSAPTSEHFATQAALLPNAGGAVAAVWSELELTSPRTADLRWRLATIR